MILDYHSGNTSSFIYNLVWTCVIWITKFFALDFYFKGWFVIIVFNQVAWAEFHAQFKWNNLWDFVNLIWDPLICLLEWFVNFQNMDFVFCVTPFPPNSQFSWIVICHLTKYLTQVDISFLEDYYMLCCKDKT